MRFPAYFEQWRAELSAERTAMIDDLNRKLAAMDGLKLVAEASTGWRYLRACWRFWRAARAFDRAVENARDTMAAWRAQ